MRTQFFASTNSRVLGNCQDSRFVVGQNGIAIALAHSLPAWHPYAGHVTWCVTAMERATKQACLCIAGRLKRALRLAMSPAMVVDRDAVRPVPPASVGSV